MATLTVYPDPGPSESTSVDGRVYTTGKATWALAHDATDGDGSGDNEGGTGISMVESSNAGGTYEIIRAFLLFDTSAIPDGDTITAATLSIWCTGKTNTDNDGQDYVNVYTTTPASNTAIVNADFDQIGTTAQATAIDYGSITADDTIYTDFTLNATGLSNISKTGITKFGLREGHDVENDSIGLTLKNDLSFRTAESTGTSNDPKLTITYSTSSPSSSASSSASSSISSSPSSSISSSSSSSPSSSVSPSSSISSSSSSSISSSSSSSVSSSISSSASSSISSSVSPSVSSSPSTSISSSASSSPSTSVSSSASTSVSSSPSSSVSPSSSISASPSPPPWTEQSKTSSTWSNRSEVSSTWTNQNESLV